MIGKIDLAGSFALGTSMTVNPMGYGAMQLAGRDGNKLVWGRSLSSRACFSSRRRRARPSPSRRAGAQHGRAGCLQLRLEARSCHTGRT